MWVSYSIATFSSVLYAPGAFAFDEASLRGSNGIGVMPTNFSVNPHDPNTTEEVEASYKQAKAMGVEWVRIVVPWFWLQDKDGTIHLEQIDKTVEMAKKYDMKVMMQITTAPEWATEIGDLSDQKKHELWKKSVAFDTFVPKPKHYDDYANFFAAVVSRYAPQGILDYEVWNEPAVAGFWSEGLNSLN